MYSEEEFEGHMKKFILSKFSFKTELQKVFHSDHIDIFFGSFKEERERSCDLSLEEKLNMYISIYEMHIIRIIYDKDTENVV